MAYVDPAQFLDERNLQDSPLYRQERLDQFIEEMRRKIWVDETIEQLLEELK